MLSYILLFTVLKLVYSFENSCSTCKFFIPRKTPELGLCSMFQDKVYKTNSCSSLINNFAVHCRNNENLCGNPGFLYEPTIINKKYKYINALHCEEFILNKQTNELVEIDKELKYVFKRMKWHNTKRVYETRRQFNKLFKYTRNLNKK
jgi:hypothetical protein